MTAAAATRTRRGRARMRGCEGDRPPASPGAEPTLFDDLGGEPTLEDLVSGVWEGLAARRVVECPVCSAEMHPEYGVHALPIGGRCKSCGSTLA